MRLCVCAMRVPASIKVRMALRCTQLVKASAKLSLHHLIKLFCCGETTVIAREVRFTDHLTSPHLDEKEPRRRWRIVYLLLDTLALELLEVLLAGFHGLGVELVFTHGPPEEKHRVEGPPR